MRRAAACLWFLTFARLWADSLPQRVDNSLSSHFPPIIRQTHESCAQEVGVSTMMTYAWNRIHGTNASDPANQFAGRFLWNFLNRGEDRGAEVAEGWELARGLGVPSTAAYAVPFDNPLGAWPSGYALYHEAMQHRVRGYAFLPMSTAADLRVIKERFAKGELFAIEGRLNGFVQVTIPEGQFDAGRKLVTRWGREGKGHVMTYVGYDDRVGYDVNGDGRLTNDLDLNADDVITLADYELGAFIAVNSYGPDWGDDGKTYVLFRESAITPFQRGRWAGKMEVVPEFQPLLTLRLKLQTTCQTAVRVRLTSADGTEYAPLLFDGTARRRATVPESPEQHSRLVTGARRLGLGPIRSDAEGRLVPVEVGLDLTTVLPLNSSSYEFAFWHAADYPHAAGTVLEAHLRRYDPKGTLISETPFVDLPRPLKAMPQRARWKR